MQQELLIAVSGAPTSDVTGTFFRHCNLDRDPLSGSASGGRWGPEGTYSVLYLGRPPESVVIEAYRHLVDDDEDGLTGKMVGPRLFSTVEIDVTSILDLRERSARELVGLDMTALRSDVDEHIPCQRVGQAAHQLGLHGVIAPAATHAGETLALFDEHLPASELPELRETVVWDHLPADPRHQLSTDEAELA